ncbi:type VI secretion system contractile sheath large subunit [Pseudomonas reactans]
MTTQQHSLPAQTADQYSILDNIVAQTLLSADDEAYGIAKRGVSAFIEELIKPQNRGEPVKKRLVDRMIAEIDTKLSLQMDEILHHPDFQALEASWKGLQLLVDRTNFRENIKIELLNVSRQDLLEDFEDSPEVIQSGLYKHIYSAEYGQFGGQPVGAIIANYFLSPSAPDVKLMQYASSVACMAHAPFIAAAGPAFFGLESFTGLPDLKDLKDHFEGPQFAKWQSFRQSEDSRYIGLTVPRFLLRTPYDPLECPVKTFAYQENVVNSHEHYLWGNTAYAFATRLTDSFARFRWCPNIIGPQSGGAVEDLPLHHFHSMGEIETKIPTEVLVSDPDPVMAAPAASQAFWPQFAQALGMQLDTLDTPGREALAIKVAGLFRHAIEGLQQSLRTRDELNSEISAALTPPALNIRNPLKACADSQAAMASLLGAGEPGELDAKQAVAQVCRDLQVHQLAMVVASRAAVRGALAAFAPEHLLLCFEREGRPPRFFTEAAHWRAYRRHYLHLVDEDSLADQLLRNDFSNAYKEQVRLVSTLNAACPG